MPISGVVITCHPQSCQAAAGVISTLAGVEVHGVLPEGQIVAVIEAEDVEGEVGLVTRIHEIDGVSAVRLAYHSFEDL
ncbi:chaperone NapD [Geomonas sp. Red32]|uniref:chaperone NapD n=1 Tax=Geomonas sp. Red32 TaxID=2912856 RepID=UPI00202CF69C|nr:chaperone NapD [Geomonas sp. Red32]